MEGARQPSAKKQIARARGATKPGPVVNKHHPRLPRGGDTTTEATLPGGRGGTTLLLRSSQEGGTNQPLRPPRGGEQADNRDSPTGGERAVTSNQGRAGPQRAVPGETNQEGRSGTPGTPLLREQLKEGG